jgi:O-acetyl-ADP-ribose deacetylase (regulator of RNase III)
MGEILRDRSVDPERGKATQDVQERFRGAELARQRLGFGYNRATHADDILPGTTGDKLMLEEIWLVHPDDAMCKAFHNRFAGLRGVKVVRGRFEELAPHHCFVTAGNAFGIMTAGIDAAVIRRFGEEFMRQVQYRIMDEFHGEQPVGTAFIMPTSDPKLPFIAHAPTMRVPGNIGGTDKVYAATWAALLAIQAHNRNATEKIEVAAFPAMGTGFGGVPFDEAARQMAAAYRHLLEPPHRMDWDFVIERHKAITYDGDRQVVR